MLIDYKHITMINDKIKFILIDYNDQTLIFDKYFSQYDNWLNYVGDLKNLYNYDCLITPGNSFGDMTGGFDLDIVILLGENIQSRINQTLNLLFPNPNKYDENSWDNAQQPIGTSVIVPINSNIFDYLCYTPTMEFVRSIVDKPNVYMAMNSALYALYKHNNNRDNKKIKLVVLPFLGTGFGHLSYDDAAKQMSSAYSYFHKNHSNIF